MYEFLNTYASKNSVGKRTKHKDKNSLSMCFTESHIRTLIQPLPTPTPMLPPPPYTMQVLPPLLQQPPLPQPPPLPPALMLPPPLPMQAFLPTLQQRTMPQPTPMLPPPPTLHQHHCHHQCHQQLKIQCKCSRHVRRRCHRCFDQSHRSQRHCHH
jgi:hypothetical protein